MTTYWVSMTLCDTQMRQRQNQVIAWDGAGSKTKGAKKNGKLSYWGEGRRRPAGRSLEKCLLCHRSTINYSNLQMAFNVGWNRKGLSFVRVFAVIGPTRFPIPCTQQVRARGGGWGWGWGGSLQGWFFTYDRSGCCNPCKFSPLLVECEEQTGCHCDKSRCTIEFAVGWCSESHF